MYDLTPTATKLYATLLQATQPLGRTELIEQANISASSYDRRIRDVRELDRIHPVQVDGHRRWTTDHERASNPLADSNEPPTPLLARRQTNPSHCVVSSHPDVWTRQRTAHADTDPGTPIQIMTQDTTRPVTTHRQSDHHDAQPSDPTPPDPPHDQTPESPATPTRHPNQRGETQ